MKARLQRHADGVRGVALRLGGKKFGLALDGCGAAAVGKADPRRHPAQHIAQGHHCAAMEHAAAVAQLRPHGELGFGAFGRAMEEIYAEEPGECGEIRDGHGRSSAAADVLIAWPAPTASRMRDRGCPPTRGSMRSAGEGGCLSSRAACHEITT